MTKLKIDKSSIIAIIGAVLIAQSLKHSQFFELYTLLANIVTFSLVILFLFQHKNVGFIISLSAYSVVTAIQLIDGSDLNWCLPLEIWLPILMKLFTLLVLLFIALGNCIKSLGHLKKIADKIWFIPGVLMILSVGIPFVMYMFDVGFSRYASVYRRIYDMRVLDNLVIAVGYLMIGLWFKCSNKEKTKKSVPLSFIISGLAASILSINWFATLEYHYFSYSYVIIYGIILMILGAILIPVMSAHYKNVEKRKEAEKERYEEEKLYETADVLMDLKNLLEMGALTQEEFDEKKKEILSR